MAVNPERMMKIDPAAQPLASPVGPSRSGNAPFPVALPRQGPRVWLLRHQFTLLHFDDSNLGLRARTCDRLAEHSEESELLEGRGP